MSELKLIIKQTDGREIEMGFYQALRLREKLQEFEDPCWHFNECGCCLSVHEKTMHRGQVGARGYVITPEGMAHLYVVGEDGEAREVEDAAG